MNIGNNLVSYLLLFDILLLTFSFTDSGKKTYKPNVADISRDGQCVRKKCSYENTCLQMVKKNRKCTLRYCNRGICSQQKPKGQPDEISKSAHQNDKRANKKFNKFTRVIRHFLWKNGIRPTETRPPMMNKCMNKRCSRDHLTCRRFNTKCRYCNRITRRCSVYGKQGTKSRCANDRECGGKNVCDIPKGLLMDRGQTLKSCISQSKIEHKAEFQRRPGNMNPFTQEDIADERKRNGGKWPAPSTYLTPQFIARHRKLFFDDPKGVSFIVRLPGTPTNNADFSLMDIIEPTLRQDRTGGIPVVPSSMMDKYSSASKSHKYGETNAMFQSVVYNYNPPSNSPARFRGQNVVLMRVDIKPEDIRQVSLRTGNEEWADADNFRIGAHTRGTVGVPDAIVNIPTEFHASYSMKNDIGQIPKPGPVPVGPAQDINVPRGWEGA